MAEKLMEEAVKKWLQKQFGERKVAPQVPLENTRLDLVAYDKGRGVFWVVECKPAGREVEIGDAFGQVSTYRSKIERRTDEFIDSASDARIEMRFARWMEATDRGIRIRAEFYVALQDEACKDVACIREFKRRYPDVGIIRHKENGTCKQYIRDEKKQQNFDLARANVVPILLQGCWTAPALGQNL